MADDIIRSLVKIQVRAAGAGFLSALFPGFAGAPATGLNPGTGGGSLNFTGFNNGGKVSGPGTSTSDSIPAWLSDGEFVVRAAAVEKFGVGLFQMLNAGIRPPRLGARQFAQGGYVGPTRTGGSSAAPLVQIVNATPAQVRTESGVSSDGRAMTRVIVGELAADLASNGRFAQTLARTYNVNRRPNGGR